MKPVRGAEHSLYDPDLPTTRAQELLSRLQRRAAGRKARWNVHLAGFASINVFLMFIDLVTRGGLWFPYPLGGMAIALLAHAIHRRRRDRLQQKLEDEIRRDPGFPDRMLRPFRKLHRSMSQLLMGLGVGGAASGYLVLINAMAGGGFWAGIPVASIGMASMLLALMVRGRRAGLQRKLESGGDGRGESLPGRRRRAIPAAEGQALSATGAHPMLDEARAIEAEIVRRSSAHGAPPDELIRGVHDLVAEIESLCALAVDYAGAMAMIQVDELDRDRETLQSRLAQNQNESLQRQYRDALEQLERQRAGFVELENRRELLELRIRTGVNALRQINVDIVRVQGDAALDEINRTVRSRTDELSGYLTDLQQSYRELSEEFGVSS
jgi:hypothetical protein